ncbi:hypothetical protein IH601_11615 [Candidatus Bipolaricaulota bacterium]|nr:hypothetical protein [Candidatus Bipolaricaulota bacterium]
MRHSIMSPVAAEAWMVGVMLAVPLTHAFAPTKEIATGYSRPLQADLTDPVDDVLVVGVRVAMSAPHSAFVTCLAGTGIVAAIHPDAAHRRSYRPQVDRIGVDGLPRAEPFAQRADPAPGRAGAVITQ